MKIIPSIGVLPEEIQAYILSKVDGKSAAVCKRVCRLWNELIEGLEECMHFWLRCCLKEIPPHILVELSKLMQLSGGREDTLVELSRNWTESLESKLPWMFWREVYAEFIRSSFILSGAEKITELNFFPLDGDVSCLYIQNNVLYSGHESGAVMCWNDIDVEMTTETLYKHHRRVTSINGVNLVQSTAEILEGGSSNIIVSGSKDAEIKLYNMDTQAVQTVIHYSKHVNYVSSWGKHFVAAADKSLIQGQPIWSVDESSLATDKVTTLYSQSASDITAVAFYEDKIVSGDEMGNLFRWQGCIHCKQEANQDMVHIGNLKSAVKSIFILGNRLLCHTSDNNLHVSDSVNEDTVEFNKLSIHDALMMTGECVTIHAAILAIGCKGGYVYLYHLPSESSWKQLNLATPSRTIKIQNEYIHALSVDDFGSGPVVAIATEHYCIYVVRFIQESEKKEPLSSSSSGATEVSR